MAMLGGNSRSHDEIRDDYQERARLNGFVAKFLEDQASAHKAHFGEHQVLSEAARLFRSREREHLEYAGWMQIAIMCVDARYDVGNSSVFDIEMAQKRWREETAHAA